MKLKYPFNKLSSFLTFFGFFQNTQIKGVTEVINDEIVRGWVFHTQNAPLSLQLKINGKIVDLQPRWTERRDVAAIHGINTLNSGYIFDLQSVNLDQSVSTSLEQSEILVLVNNTALPLTGEAKIAENKKNLRMEWSNIDLILQNDEVHSYIDCWGSFSVRGFVAINHAPPRSLVVKVSGKEYPLCPIWKEHHSSRKKYKTNTPQTGYEVDLPGIIWNRIGLNSDLEFQLLADGQPLTPQPLILTRKLATKWISEAIELPDSNNHQFRKLLAMEHLYFSGLTPQLSVDVQKEVQKFSKKMQLEDLELTTDFELSDIPSEEVSTLILWNAMRRLNTKLQSSTSEKSFVLIEQILSESQLKGDARDWFLQLAIQLTCENGEFHKLLNLLNIETYRQLAASELPQHISICLPVFIGRGHYLEAIKLLERLRCNLFHGWFHSYCIRYSVDEMQRLESEGLIDINIAEKFRYEFLKLLDAFEGEWFSRLHDKQLVYSMIRLLQDMEHYSDYMKRDVAAAALRNYGLCPVFWEAIADSDHGPLPPELLLGFTKWNTIHSIIENWPTGEIDQEASSSKKDLLLHLVEPLHWFSSQGNQESVIVLREAVMNNLPELGQHLNPALQLMLDALLTSDEAEHIRIAASPIKPDSLKQLASPDINKAIFKTLSRISQYKRSFVYDIQCSAAVILREVAIAGNKDSIVNKLEELRKKSFYLSNWHCNFLSADILAWGVAQASKAKLKNESLIISLHENIRAAIKSAKATYYLPAPVLSALNQLHALPQDRLIKALVQETEAAIREKFSVDQLESLQLPANPVLSIDNRTLPADTLVTIISTSTRLHSNNEIRKTWLAELIARGIPYLFVVGGGKNSVKGDTLALNVSDSTEDRPKKIVQMFDWVYRNTSVRYVLKIEDDCYLDVEGFFDSLCYRKHYYYGHIAKRSVGSIERVIKVDSKSTGQADILLDKSPEPSTYASGVAAYTLSRLAINKLLNIATTPFGIRLISTSTREDKLVGDLLAQASIHPSDEDYGVLDRRCLTANSLPINSGANTFFPSKISPTAVVHLDRLQDITYAHEISHTEELWPKKIWPTNRAPSIAVNSNQLELISDLEDVSRVLSHRVAVVGVVRNEMIMLPHFLDHYRKIGVKCFIFADNCSNDGTREYLHGQDDVVLYSSDTEYKHSHYGVAWQQAILGNHCLGKWVILADADEFLIYEDCEKKGITSYVNEIEAESCDSVFLHMIDMYPFGDLDEASFENDAPFKVAPYFDREAQIELKFGGGEFSNSRNFVNGLRHRIAPSRINAYISHKHALFKYMPWIRLSEGVHYSANMKPSAKPAFFAHFKYHAGFKNKVLAEIKRNQHFNGAEEYQRYAGILAEGKGEFGDKKLSTKYVNSKTFVELFKL